MEFVIAALVGIILTATVLFLYFFYADRTLDLLGAPIDWADFATFFGGIAGPLVLWALLFLLIYCLRQQKSEILEMARESRRQDMLRYLHYYESELTHLLQREFTESGRQVEFADFIEGTYAFPKSPDVYFRSSLDKLLRAAANYCESIGAYRSELQGNFLFGIHDAKARNLIGCLDKHKEHLSPMARQALTFCKTHLEGKNGS